jgi:rubredoxin
MYHDKAYKIDMTQKAINKRFTIIKNWFGGKTPTDRWNPPRNKLNKYNLVCSCPMCKTQRNQFKYHRNKEKICERKEIDSYNNY